MATIRQHGNTGGRLRVSSIPANYALSVLHPREKNPVPTVPPSMRKNFHLNHPDLSKGQKRYLWSICSAYSTVQMKKLVQDQYLKQLLYEAEKGIVRAEDLYKYLRYLADPTLRKQQFQQNPGTWRASREQYQFRYYRDHPVDQPMPVMPGYVSREIGVLTRPISVAAPRRFIPRKRRDKGKPVDPKSSKPRSHAERHAHFLLSPTKRP